MSWSSAINTNNINDYPVHGSWARCSIKPPFFDRDGKLIKGWTFEFHRSEKPTLILKEDGLVKSIDERVVTVHKAGEPATDGLTKLLMEGLPEADIVEVEPGRYVELPSQQYSDFKYCLSYALERFGKIAKEVSRGIRYGPGLRHLGEGAKESTWRSPQNETMAAFYTAFCKAVVESKLTLRQKRRLIGYAAPLKRESKEVAYLTPDKDNPCRYQACVYGRVPDNVQRAKPSN